MENIKLKTEINFKELNNNIGNSNIIKLDDAFYFINMELVSREELINQFLGEYLAKFLFGLPTGESSLFKASNRVINNTVFPHFVDEERNNYLLLTKINESDKNLLTKFPKEIFDDKNPSQKLGYIKRYFNNDQIFNELKEYFIKLSLLDFYMGQYGRDLLPYVNFSNNHITSVYSLGNSFDFNQTYNKLDSCTTIFGNVNIEDLICLSRTSNNYNFYKYILTKLNFSQLLTEFLKSFILLIDKENQEKYIDFIKEKQNILKRSL